MNGLKAFLFDNLILGLSGFGRRGGRRGWYGANEFEVGRKEKKNTPQML